MEFHSPPNTKNRISTELIWVLVTSFVVLTVISFTASPVSATDKRFEHLRFHSFFRRITWTPPAVTTTIAPGESQTLFVSLTAARTLRNVGVRVARELQPFVHVEPATFKRIGKGHTVNINVTISVPSSVDSGTFRGKLRLFRELRLGFGRKRKTIAIPLLLARPLPVVIDIEPTAPVITVTTPEDGATVATESLLVSGTVEAGGEEVGVTVNDFPAAVQGNIFGALVPITPETTTLTVIATTPSGATANHSITVATSALPTPTIALRSSPPSGVAPLTVGFSLVGGPVPTAIDLDLVGDGIVDFSGPSLEGQTFTYPEPGVFFPTVTLTDAKGNQHTGTTIVQVYDQAALDALLQAKWTGMKGALRAGEVARAVTFIHTAARAAYGSQLARFSPATLANIDQYITTIQLVEVGPGGAQYEMLRDRNGQILSFAVWFQVDQDGIWRLRRF
ncbi:MAG: PKD domain-containing protein [Candidatus Methylomirabilales bacterium]